MWILLKFDKKNLTILIISHGYEFFKNVNNILTFNDGKIEIK